jgi:hypothetical protein
MPDVDAYFADPARRTGGKRISTLDETQPSPRALLDRLPKNAAVAFKLAPGISLADQQNLEGELEFLSVQGELKECVWWSGPLRSTRRRATLLPSGYSLASESEREMSPPGEPQRYLFEPDAAIVRAGLVPLLAEQLDAQPLDHLVQLLTSDEPRATPFGQWWEVMAVCKYDLKAVNAELRRHDIGRVTPVHYGAAPDAAEWSKRLKPVGSRSARLVLTRVLGRFVVVICSAE